MGSNPSKSFFSVFENFLSVTAQRSKVGSVIPAHTDTLFERRVIPYSNISEITEASELNIGGYNLLKRM